MERDLGEKPEQQMINRLNKYQELIYEDVGLKDTSSSWKTVCIDNACVTQALFTEKSAIDTKALKSLIKFLLIAVIAYKVLSYWVSIPAFFAGIVIQMALLSKIQTLLNFSPQIKMVKTRAIIKGVGSHTLGKHIFACFAGEVAPNHIDYFQVSPPLQLSKNEDCHTITTKEMYDVPHGSFARQFVKGPMERKMTTYWASESNSEGEGVFYIIRKSQSSDEVEEAIVVVPMSKKSSQVYFISNFDPLEDCKVQLIRYLYADSLKIQRTTGLLTLLQEQADALSNEKQGQISEEGDNPFDVASNSDNSTLSNNEATEALRKQKA